MSARYDVVHFAGHALFAEGPVKSDDRGYLVFSGFPQPEAVPIARVASWLKNAGVQLVYLSCCRSSAASAALEFSRCDIPMAIGFHWDLDDAKAPVFARQFYQELLATKLKVCPAVSNARRKLFQEYDKGDPIWASPRPDRAAEGLGGDRRGVENRGEREADRPQAGCASRQSQAGGLTGEAGLQPSAPIRRWCYIAAPSDHELRMDQGHEQLHDLITAFRSDVPGKICGRWCRNFRSTVLELPASGGQRDHVPGRAGLQHLQGVTVRERDQTSCGALAYFSVSFVTTSVIDRGRPFADDTIHCSVSRSGWPYRPPAEIT